nr:hypothetical protein [Tanacetum cinerariifolium]
MHHPSPSSLPNPPSSLHSYLATTFASPPQPPSPPPRYHHHDHLTIVIISIRTPSSSPPCHHQPLSQPPYCAFGFYNSTERVRLDLGSAPR